MLKRRESFRRAYGKFSIRDGRALREAPCETSARRSRRDPQPAQDRGGDRQREKDPGAGRCARMMRPLEWRRRDASLSLCRTRRKRIRPRRCRLGPVSVPQPTFIRRRCLPPWRSCTAWISGVEVLGAAFLPNDLGADFAQQICPNASRSASILLLARHSRDWRSVRLGAGAAPSSEREMKNKDGTDK